VRRLQPITLVATLGAVLLLLPGCRSTHADLEPMAPATPEPIAAGEPEAAEAAAETPAPEPVPGGTEEEASVPDGEELLDDEAPSGEGASDPQTLQKEALELCQSAEALLDQGASEEALSALDGAYELMLALPANGEADEDSTLPQAKADIRRLVAELIHRIYASERVAAAPVTSWDLALPIVDNQHVRREIQSFTGAEREQFLEGYRRSGRYRPMILAKLEEAGLPSQLSWLPLVESWFKVRALSRASALGMWQFISSTGQRYGLSRDAWIDERLDPEKSTDAAIAYLTELHGLFGDWPKALAAYNCGEVRVLRLQRRSQEYLDFWDLYELLPHETRRYVPRLLAALEVIEKPERYGITLPDPDPPPADLTTVTVERAVKLQSLETVLGLPTGALQELNPELRFHATPKRPYPLRVPASQEAAVLANLGTLPEWKPPAVEYVTHRVRSGETLSVIARRYHTSISAIMRSNRIRSQNRIYLGQRLRIPVRGSAAAQAQAPAPARLVNGVHTVRRGESLLSIAKRYGTTVAQLKQDNHIDSDLIYPGQSLRVLAAASAAGRRYEVRAGDTLGAIAEHYKVPLSSLLTANGLRSRSRIYPGQSLIIPD